MQAHLVSSPSCLRAHYAMSGTELARRAICLRECYAMSGTEIAQVFCHGFAHPPDHVDGRYDSW
eukprot:3287107-Rhodomonas_salina.4